MRVFVMKYHHRHGEDLSVHHSAAGAEKAMAELARDNLDEFAKAAGLDEEQVEELQQMIADPKRHDEILSAWDGYEGEWFAIDSYEVEP